MRQARQTPHGARPNREGVRGNPNTCRLGAFHLRVGRSSYTVMCGLEEWPSCRKADRIRLTGPAATFSTTYWRAVENLARFSPRLRMSIAEAPYSVRSLDVTNPSSSRRVQVPNCRET